MAFLIVVVVAFLVDVVVFLIVVVVVVAVVMGWVVVVVVVALRIVVDALAFCVGVTEEGSSNISVQPTTPVQNKTSVIQTANSFIHFIAVKSFLQKTM